MARTADPIADVEKAIKAHDKAHEKAQTAEQKADEARAAEKRALRELQWYANHPDLPDDFDLVDFRRSLEAPFDEPADDVDPVEPDEDEVAAVAEAEAEIAAADEDDDDPFDDED